MTIARASLRFTSLAAAGLLLSAGWMTGCAGELEGADDDLTASVEQASRGRGGHSSRSGHSSRGRGDSDHGRHDRGRRGHDRDRDDHRGAHCGDRDGDDAPAFDIHDDILECGSRGSTGDILVTFTCDTVTVEACKELSNVVLDYGDAEEKLECLPGKTATLTGTAPLEGVWVKAGNNASGDGPGYGQYFQAPAGGCDDGGDDGGEDDGDADGDGVIAGEGGDDTGGGIDLGGGVGTFP